MQFFVDMGKPASPVPYPLFPAEMQTNKGDSMLPFSVPRGSLRDFPTSLPRIFAVEDLSYIDSPGFSDVSNASQILLLPEYGRKMSGKTLEEQLVAASPHHLLTVYEVVCAAAIYSRCGKRLFEGRIRTELIAGYAHSHLGYVNLTVALSFDRSGRLRLEKENPNARNPALSALVASKW